MFWSLVTERDLRPASGAQFPSPGAVRTCQLQIPIKLLVKQSNLTAHLCIQVRLIFRLSVAFGNVTSYVWTGLSQGWGNMHLSSPQMDTQAFRTGCERNLRIEKEVCGSNVRLLEPTYTSHAQITLLTLTGSYIAGKEIETYSETARDLDTLEKYLDKKTGPPPSVHRSSPLSGIDGQPSTKKTFNPDGKVLALDSSGFWQTVASEPTFVKFYAPWCHHCQKLAPTWIDLAAALAGVVNVAEVNCDAHGSLCRKQEVEGFPVLKLCVPPSFSLHISVSPWY